MKITTAMNPFKPDYKPNNLPAIPKPSSNGKTNTLFDKFDTLCRRYPILTDTRVIEYYNLFANCQRFLLDSKLPVFGEKEIEGFIRSSIAYENCSTYPIILGATLTHLIRIAYLDGNNDQTLNLSGIKPVCSKEEPFHIAFFGHSVGIVIVAGPGQILL
mgnify:CR=1 FL=1